MKIKIGLVEDNPNLVKSITSNFSVIEKIEQVFIANTGKEAVEKVNEYDVDILLMDISMPEMSGIEATKIIREKHPQLKILMHTIFDDNEKIFDSILAGANGYILKDEKPQKVLEALQEVMKGGAAMSSSIATKALQLLRNSSPGKTKEEGAKKFNLSEREMEVLQEISLGLNYQQIADKLFIAPKTVRKHIENIYKKLQVHSKVEAVQKATKYNILKGLIIGF